MDVLLDLIQWVLLLWLLLREHYDRQAVEQLHRNDLKIAGRLRGKADR